MLPRESVGMLAVEEPVGGRFPEEVAAKRPVLVYDRRRFKKRRRKKMRHCPWVLHYNPKPVSYAHANKFDQQVEVIRSFS